MFILDHNFWTRNVRKSIKGSKDLDSSLVSNENFSETLWPSGWALGQATWAKMTLKLLHLWRQSWKICTPQPKKKKTKMPCPLPYNHYCCLLPSPAHLYMPPNASPPSSVLCWCLLFFCIFAICYISLWHHLGLFVCILSLSFLFLFTLRSRCWPPSTWLCIDIASYLDTALKYMVGSKFC